MAELSQNEKNRLIKNHVLNIVNNHKPNPLESRQNYVSWDVAENNEMLEEQLNKENDFDF